MGLVKAVLGGLLWAYDRQVLGRYRVGLMLVYWGLIPSLGGAVIGAWMLKHERLVLGFCKAGCLLISCNFLDFSSLYISEVKS